jgi:hypothetical protein
MAMLLAGCAAGPGPSSYCSVARPILVEAADVLTPPTMRAIVEHNETGEALCGWLPPA